MKNNRRVFLTQLTVPDPAKPGEAGSAGKRGY